jgi:DNA-directed RNA polymerase III subunit RPC1
LRIDEVAVPEKVAIKLSYPERVTDYNIVALRQNIIHGSKLHPGANVIEKKSETGGAPFRVALHMVREAEKRTKFARELKIGDVVHRHLRDGE